MRVALYARVSTTRQAQTQTIEQQVNRLRAAAAERGWTLGEQHVYRDDGYSGASLDRKSTRLNSSHANISYAVFCLKKKKKNVPPASSALSINNLHHILHHLIFFLSSPASTTHIPATPDLCLRLLSFHPAIYTAYLL